MVNRTRVLSIRIEPDWNVNEEYKETLMNAIKIRIEPDWNVNPSDSSIYLRTSALE